MASQKQELIQLHQFLAETRYFAKDQLNLDAKIEDLSEYREIGVTSMQLNAGIEKQTDAILALASDLSTVFSNAIEAEYSAENTTTTQENATGSIPSNTIETTLYQVTSEGIDTESVVANQPTKPEPEPETVTADTEQSPYGSTKDTPVVVSKTSLTDFVPEPETESGVGYHVDTTEETTTSEAPEQVTLTAV